ncbi:MAG TPA: Gfo/Idh/MocA family oxidoreductase [Pirellulales bacterium]|jgi:predicted dehydrogenase|nr:Gfo/Idh/MocA family oxidoreductase [Pirellulales bacterium]
MDQICPASTSRREFLKSTGLLAAGTALTAAAVPQVHAGEDNTIRLALVGCGGRGTGAVGDALSVRHVPIKLVAMADVFHDRLNESYKTLKEKHTDQIDVPDDHKFIGFDAYQKAMDCLRPGDIAIFATPPAFRWVHFTYAIEKNLNVFQEKPLAVDGPAARKMFALGEQSRQKGLKVAVGLMCRHCRARRELYDRIANDEIGDLLLLRAYRMSGPTGSCFSGPKPEKISELMWQIQRFHSFLWASGGSFSDFLIHNIDECCWMKDAWPVQAKGYGGRHFRGDNVDQNFDSYTVEYTFPDGAKFMLEGRNIAGCYDEFASYIHGTKGSGVISTSAHTPAKCRLYKSQHINTKDDLVWAYPQPEKNPYQLEWQDLIDAIRHDYPYNEVQRGVEASLVTAMGRMACHTGKLITYDDMLHCDHEFAPNVDKLTLDSASPLVADKDGKYPVPMPGLNKREYA